MNCGLTWEGQISNVIRKVYFSLSRLWCTASFTPIETRRRLVVALILPIFLYCDVIEDSILHIILVQDMSMGFPVLNTSLIMPGVSWGLHWTSITLLECVLFSLRFWAEVDRRFYLTRCSLLALCARLMLFLHVICFQIGATILYYSYTIALKSKKAGNGFCIIRLYLNKIEIEKKTPMERARYPRTPLPATVDVVLDHKHLKDPCKRNPPAILLQFSTKEVYSNTFGTVNWFFRWNGVYRKRYNHELNKYFNSPNAQNVTKTSRRYVGHIIRRPEDLKGEIKVGWWDEQR
jgi:hypothetical protein